ncbi:unnamed protein product [Heterobilharzia americana]|nr:unnamed protein product [Heterobilharzia americana]CAH8594260.1 unnamed protein product [Heterobilharzia americana]
MRYKSGIRNNNNNSGNNTKSHYSSKNKKKFKPKYDSRIHLVKQRIIQKQRAQFTFQNSKLKVISNEEEKEVQSKLNRPKEIVSVPISLKPLHTTNRLDKDEPVTEISPLESHPNRLSTKFNVNLQKKKSEVNPLNEHHQDNLNKSTSDLYTSTKSKEVWFDDVPQALIAHSMQDQSATTKSLVKSTSFTGPTRRIAMDCEFVGVGFEGKDDALARVSIVNQFGHILLDTYVRPEERVVDYRTKFSGIRAHDLRKNGSARSFHDVHKQVAELIKNRILVGHSILKDLKVLRLSHPRRFIRDTSRYRPFRDLFSGRIPSLKGLTQKVLGVTVQAGEHDSIEDARATMRLYTSVKRVWESSKKNRTPTGKNIKKAIPIDKQGTLDIKDEYESGLHEDKSNSTHQQVITSSTKSRRDKTSLQKSKRWDPLRGRKCSKNRLKFINKHRKLHKK